MYEWQYATATGQMYNQINYQKMKEATYVAISTQKGGAGKTVANT